MIQFAHPDNFFHYFNDGAIPLLTTLIHLGLLPDHVKRSGPCLHALLPVHWHASHSVAGGAEQLMCTCSNVHMVQQYCMNLVL
jgi:hypothetical protein